MSAYQSRKWIKSIYQRERRFCILAQAHTNFYCISLQARSASEGSSNAHLPFTHNSFACASGLLDKEIPHQRINIHRSIIKMGPAISFRAGSVSDGFASLRKRTQTFIAYLYKPEAQAKVLQMLIYHSHIIPSLALLAC